MEATELSVVEFLIDCLISVFSLSPFFSLFYDQFEALNILFPNIWLAAAEYKKFI